MTTSPTPSEIPSETASETASETPSDTPGTAGTAGDSDTVPAWVWWLLAALLVAGAVGVPLLLRSRRRHAWQAELATAELEVTWFARTLFPELRNAGTPEAIRGAWSVSEPRVAEAEDGLTALIASAPDPELGDRAVSLRDGVREARSGIRAVIASGSPDTTTALDALVVDLEAVLAPPAAPSPEAPPAADAPPPA